MKNLILALGILLSANTFAHKFYISIADMEYKELTKKIDVTLKVTAHDFELILNRKFNKEIHLEEVGDSSEVGLYCQAYLRNNFKVISNDQKLEQKYLGKEVTNREDLYFYFSFLNVGNPAHIKIISNLLSSVSDLQQNIVHYKYKNQTKSVTLLPSENKAEIKFD
jgi:Domain of unknown function (DUF6702)